ncbi:MAG: methionine--tRNA ligase, partial [Alphaproteobacteria bacterium]
MAQTYYITTPIYYVNDKPHIGHAYTTLACDVLARFKRLDGFDVTFLTGTDEHGQKVEKAASDKGVSPQSFTDEVSQNFRDLTAQMNFSNDDFIRTTEQRHKRACQEIWQRLQERGHIRLGNYAGWYSVRDEAFFTETEVVDGKAPTGAPVEWVEEPSYFFNLSEWQQPLLDHYEA